MMSSTKLEATGVAPSKMQAFQSFQRRQRERLIRERMAFTLPGARRAPAESQPTRSSEGRGGKEGPQPWPGPHAAPSSRKHSPQGDEPWSQAPGHKEGSAHCRGDYSVPDGPPSSNGWRTQAKPKSNTSTVSNNARSESNKGKSGVPRRSEGTPIWWNRHQRTTNASGTHRPCPEQPPRRQGCPLAEELHHALSIERP